MFGPKFLDEYGDAPSRMWVVAVAGLSDAQLQRGFMRLMDEGRKWPPNLSEFTAACRRPEPVRYLGVPCDPSLLLPAPDKLAKPETRDAALARIRATLAKRNAV